MTLFSCLPKEISFNNPYWFTEHKTNLSSMKHPSGHSFNALKDAGDHGIALLFN